MSNELKMGAIPQINQYHYKNKDGMPHGGLTHAIGLAIQWQAGPVNTSEGGINGAFVEQVIDAAIGRLEFYENNGFGCIENRSALDHLKTAYKVLEARTARRKQEQIEGTYGKGAGDDK